MWEGFGKDWKVIASGPHAFALLFEADVPKGPSPVEFPTTQYQSTLVKVDVP